MQTLLGQFMRGRAAVALLLLRLVFGIGIVLHGWDKVVNGGPFHWADNMGSLGDLPPPMQALATLTEIGAGAALILGLLTPPAMMALAFAMCVAVYKGHLVNGEGYVSLSRPYKPTFELAAHYLAVACAFLLSGPGTLSLDYLLFGRRPSSPPVSVP